VTVKYDPSVIVTFAERLYAQARRVAIIYATFGAVSGYLVVARYVVGGQDSTVLAIGGSVALGSLRAGIGWERAFSLGLQAQVALALCQLQIEANRRRR
jgi:hypothetical protein